MYMRRSKNNTKYGSKTKTSITDTRIDPLPIVFQDYAREMAATPWVIVLQRASKL